MRRLVPALLLVAYGGAFAVAAFGGGLPAYDDHPGQYFRLWHALERSFPGGHWTADWNPDWWGGYPELQFYPPGFVLAGAAVLALGASVALAAGGLAGTYTTTVKSPAQLKGKWAITFAKNGTYTVAVNGEKVGNEVTSFSA